MNSSIFEIQFTLFCISFKFVNSKLYSNVWREYRLIIIKFWNCFRCICWNETIEIVVFFVNFRHVFMRNVIKRNFEIFKRRFKIIRVSFEFFLTIQKRTKTFNIRVDNSQQFHCRLQFHVWYKREIVEQNFYQIFFFDTLRATFDLFDINMKKNVVASDIWKNYCWYLKTTQIIWTLIEKFENINQYLQYTIQYFKFIFNDFKIVNFVRLYIDSNSVSKI